MEQHELYLQYLTNIIDPLGRNNQQDLLRKLFFHPFEWIHRGNLAHDENRAIDGKQLRVAFMRDYPGVKYDLEIAANCLEVMVALAINIDNGLVAGNGDHPKWFWLMCSNLGLLDPNCNVEDALNRWLFRGFSWNGEGSPFPLRSCKFDQRRVELWLQACGYFSEFFDFSGETNETKLFVTPNL